MYGNVWQSCFLKKKFWTNCVCATFTSFPHCSCLSTNEKVNCPFLQQAEHEKQESISSLLCFLLDFLARYQACMSTSTARVGSCCISTAPGCFFSPLWSALIVVGGQKLSNLFGQSLKAANAWLLHLPITAALVTEWSAVYPERQRSWRARRWQLLYTGSSM